MQLRNKLHPLMLIPDHLSKLAKKYGHFQIQIPLQVFCRDLSKFTQFEPWQLHQALYKMLNSDTISWSSFLQLLKDDCKTRSNLITELLDQNQTYCFALEQNKYDKLNYQLKLSQKEDIRQFKRIFLFNFSFSMLMLDDQLLIVQQKQQSVVSKLVFNPIPQERETQTVPLLNPESNQKVEKYKKQRSKISDFPSQILQKTTRSVRNNSLINKTSSKVEKKHLQSILDLSLDESVHIGKSIVNQAFDTLRFPATTQAYPSYSKTQFDPWKFVGTMKTLRSNLNYNPHNVPLDKKIETVHTPKDKQVFNRALTLNKKIATSNIPIESFSVDLDYVAVILKNKQLRLLKLKKYPFNKIVTSTVLVKTFKWFPVYIHLFRTILNDNLHILVAFQLDKKAKIKAFKLVLEQDKKTQTSQARLVQIYSEQINFSPMYQPMTNYFAMYDEFGRLQVLDLTCRDHDTLSTKFNTKIQNPYLNKTIPISACTYHSESFTLIVGCKNGYLHTLSEHSPEPKRHKKITSKHEILSLVCSLEYVIALTFDGFCLLVNPYSLNEMNRIDLNEHSIKKIHNLYKVQNKDSILIYGKTIQQLDLVINKNKIKQIRRSKYQHLTKVKLLNNDLPAVQVINQDIIHKIKISENHLIIIFQNSNLIKIFPSLTKSTSFIPDKQTTSIIDVAMQKKGNLIAIAYDSFDVEVRNIYNQNLLYSVTLNDFPNCLIFITKDHTSMINVNTEQGNINLIDSKGVLKNIYNTKTSLTSTIQTKNNLIVGDCFGSLYVFSETSMMLLHQINLKNSQGIKLIRDIPKLKIIRVLSFGNTIYDIDVQNGRITSTVTPKCGVDEIIHDITQTGFIQQTTRGIFVGEIVETKDKPALRSRISSRARNPSTDMIAKTLMRMASESIRIDDNPNIMEEKFIHYQELNLQKDKVKSIHTVMNRLTIIMGNCTAIYVDNNKKLDVVSLLM